MLLEEFIKRQFKVRDAAHRAHWVTDSGYRHETLSEFYTGVVKQADKIVEASVAAFGDKPKGDDEAIAAEIREQLIWLAKNRKALALEVPALENLVDEVSAFYLNTLYKLENLR